MHVGCDGVCIAVKCNVMENLEDIVVFLLMIIFYQRSAFSVMINVKKKKLAAGCFRSFIDGHIRIVLFLLVRFKNLV